MTAGEQLLALAQDYIAGRATLADLDNWLAANAQDLAQADASDPSARLSGVIEVTLAEMDAGHATEENVRGRIESFLAEQNVPRRDAGRVAS